MARIGSRRGNENLLPIDSLMDILTGTVGIMIIVAVFTVLEVAGMSFTLFKPIGREPQTDMKMEAVLIQDGKLRVLNIGPIITKLLTNALSGGKDSINKEINDAWFKYKLKIKSYGLYMVITEREGLDGEDIDEMDDTKSHYRSMLTQLDSKKSWLLFMVDEKSIGAFRRAREIGRVAGFVSGWNPTKKIDFPIAIPLSGGGGSLELENKIQTQ